MTDEGGNFVDSLVDIPANYSFPVKSASCKTADIKLGAKLVVVGYPTVGGATVTVTEGIVSGFDGDYIKTSAKIEHGNSGGGAFLVPSGCWIGIPSASAVGGIESLGRILRWDK
jgi:S1-C subfamily serine protease